MTRSGAISLALVLIAAGATSQQPPASAAPSGGVRVGDVLAAKPRGPEPPDDPLARLLFPPELVMQQQRAIGLKPEQRSAITRAIGEAQGKVLDLQWQLQDEVQRLAELLSKPTVDQAAALAQVDKVLAVEREVKRTQLGLMIQIKNTLTPEQQAKLAQARAGREAQ